MRHKWCSRKTVQKYVSLDRVKIKLKINVNILRERMGHWWAPRISNPLRGAKSTTGEFDSHPVHHMEVEDDWSSQRDVTPPREGSIPSHLPHGP